MISRRKLILFATIFIGTQTVYADGLGWLFHPGKSDPNSEFHKRLPEHFKDDITSDQNAEKLKLTSAEKHQALVWGLSNDEEKRYLFLMQNQSGYFYGVKIIKTPEGNVVYAKKETPVEILGFNARTDAEREKYAQEDAQQQIQYMAKYLAYITAYQRAAENLKEKLNLPVVAKFNYQKFSPYSYHPISLQSGDKLMLFIHPKDEVKPIIASLLSAIQKNKSISLNIYFLGKKINQSLIETWARDQNIPPEFVKSHRITLNFDNDQYQQLKTNQKTPLLVLIRDGNSRFVDMSRF